MKVHWHHNRWTRTAAACGVDKDKARISVTDDPGNVTCQSCEQQLDRDLRTLDEQAEIDGAAKARQRGRTRAVAELVELHRGEFEDLWSLYELEEQAVAVVEAKRDLELRAKWDEQYRARKRAELEAELERL